MAEIRVGDNMVDVLDKDCEFRSCFTLGFDKGSFTPGVGYTRYHAKERPVCWTRHLNGCPTAGCHLKCGACHKLLGVVMDGEPRVLPDECPLCWSTDLYWLADVHLPVSLCCDAPNVPATRPGQRVPLSQRCRSCGTMLRGERLERARVPV